MGANSKRKTGQSNESIFTPESENTRPGDTVTPAEGDTEEGSIRQGGRNSNSSRAENGRADAQNREVVSSEAIRLPVKKDIPAVNVPNDTGIPTPPAAAPAKKKRSKSTEIALDRTLESNVRMLISLGFGMAGKLTQYPEVWQITDGEAESIAVPTTRIMQRMGVSETANKYADYIALIAAVSVVVIPRYMTQRQMAENKKAVNPPLKLEKGKGNGKTRTTQNNPKESNGSNPAANAPAAAPNIKSILDTGF